MNRLPPRKKRGDPVLAEDWNAMLDAIASRTPRPGTGLELIASSGGFAYSRTGPGLAPTPALPPFAVIGIEKKDGGYRVTVKEGWVIERKPKSGDTPTVKFHIPKVGEETLDTIPRPQIAMSFGDTLWCKIVTDEMGEISEEPEILAAAEDQDGNHYYPEDPEGSGSDGEYFVKLFKLEDDGGTPKVKVYQQSDIEHWAQLWTGENVGGGANVFKDHKEDSNIYRFRTIRGDYGISENQTADEVELDFRATNVGAGKPVWVQPLDGSGQPDEDPPDGPARFRSIAGRATQPEIRVKCEPPNPGDPLPQEIRIEGNGYDAGVTAALKITMTVRDGLVKSLLSEDAGGGNLNLEIHNFTYNNDGELYGQPYLSGILYWRDGVFAGVTDPTPGNEPPGLLVHQVAWLVSAA
jgi:hypothetical protein